MRSRVSSTRPARPSHSCIGPLTHDRYRNSNQLRAMRQGDDRAGELSPHMSHLNVHEHAPPYEMEPAAACPRLTRPVTRVTRSRRAGIFASSRKSQLVSRRGTSGGGGAPGARNGTLSSVEADASLREGNGSACRHSTRTSTERLQADKKTAPNSDAGSRRQSDGASSAAQSPALQPGPIVDGISKRHAALRLLASARHCQDQAARCKNDTDGGTEPLRALPSQPSPV